jgi:hypothetical protein
MPAAQRLLILELNEINFEYVERYAARGFLPTFHNFLSTHGYSRTASETRYEELEPWIQWVSAHTGLTLAEHGVFRLGDIVKKDLPQIWDVLEARGFTVGAVSPMNASCRVRAPAFFIPDPWTETRVVAPPIYRRLHAAIAQAVADNSQGKLTGRSAFDLARGGAAAAQPANYARYARLVAGARRRPWNRALFLDLLLADLFIGLTRRTRPDFATLFLNAGAHIQHHYMFSSAAYDGPMRNPSWYIGAGQDPLLDVYTLYDTVLAQVLRAFPDARIMLATGLHQDPYPKLTYYWRLRDHSAFLTRIGVPFERTEPRMSRDFFVRCRDAEQARIAAERLEAALLDDGAHMFAVDRRDTDLFVELAYPGEITPGSRITIAGEVFNDINAAVAFVAIKNVAHNGVGYFADSGTVKGTRPMTMPLIELNRQMELALAA